MSLVYYSNRVTSNWLKEFSGHGIFISKAEHSNLLFECHECIHVMSVEKRDVQLRQNSPMCILHFFNTIYNIKGIFQLKLSIQYVC